MPERVNGNVSGMRVSATGPSPDRPAAEPVTMQARLPQDRVCDRRHAGAAAWVRGWRKYAAAFRVSARAQLAYPGEVVMRTLFLLLILFIFSSLWHATFAETGRARLGGLTLTQMLWYLALTEAVILSRPRTALRLDEEVRTGDFAYALGRPYRFVLYRFAQAQGERAVRLVLNLVVALPLALLFSGGVGLSAAGLLPGAALLLLAVTADYLFTLSVQMLAFWVEDTTSLLFIYDRLLMILGGVLLPVGLFPGPVAAVARALPFSAMINGPAEALVRFDADVCLTALVRLTVTCVVGGAVAAAVFRLSVRRAGANGG